MQTMANDAIAAYQRECKAAIKGVTRQLARPNERELAAAAMLKVGCGGCLTASAKMLLCGCLFALAAFGLPAARSAEPLTQIFVHRLTAVGDQVGVQSESASAEVALPIVECRRAAFSPPTERRRSARRRRRAAGRCAARRRLQP